MSRTGWKLPGANEWNSEYISCTNLGDYNNNQPGVVKFYDGTIWRMETEAATPATAFPLTGLQVFEFVPESKGWEQLTGDQADTMVEDAAPPAQTSGDMNNFIGGWSDYWTCAQSGEYGDDLVYCISTDDPNYGYKMIVFNKADRTWQHYANEIDASNTAVGFPWPATLIADPSAPVFDDTYIYWMSWQSANYPYRAGTVNKGRNLCRARRESPGTVEVIASFVKGGLDGTGPDEAYPQEWLSYINPVTGLPNCFNSNIIWGGQNVVAAIDEGYIYLVENAQISTESGTFRWHSIRRIRIGSDIAELLYYWYGTFGYVTYSFDEDFEWNSNKLPVGVGVAPLYNSTARVRDGWLYWLDVASQLNSQGITFNRIYLPPLVKDGPKLHDPYSPTFEILNNASAPAEGDGKWVQPSPWGILWRGGSSPIHNTTDSNWFFDDDGGINFIHEEFPAWRGYSNYFTTWVLSRLVPPAAGTINVNLIFEGNALKGYGRVRELDRPWAPEEVHLI